MGFGTATSTYRVAVLKDVAAVALEAGNSLQVIFSNYRALATEAEANSGSLSLRRHFIVFRDNMHAENSTED